MREYEVFIKNLDTTSPKVYVAASPKDARALAEADGYRVKLVAPK